MPGSTTKVIILRRLVKMLAEGEKDLPRDRATGWYPDELVRPVGPICPDRPQEPWIDNNHRHNVVAGGCRDRVGFNRKGYRGMRSAP